MLDSLRNPIQNIPTNLTTLQLHTTQTISGLLFIGMVVLMLNGTLAEFNALIPPDLAIWFGRLEDQLINLFAQ